MKRAFVVFGVDPETLLPDIWYAICHSVKRAEELAYEAEEEDPSHLYVWHWVDEEDD